MPESQPNLLLPSYVLKVRVPRLVTVAGKRLGREDFYEWLWQELGSRGLLGVHEGTLLSEDAAREGYETDSWTVDSGEAPRERDWVADQAWESAELYFSGMPEARAAAERLKAELPELEVGAIEEQKAQDWDARWKASFQGADVPPYWRILPPWVQAEPRGRERILRINPGAGFGTGTHETTQLCLGAIAQADARKPLAGERALDFGSGSGILSIGLALLGAQVDAVEIDPLANENATENARLNDILSSIRIHESLDGVAGAGKYALVVANILRPVLLQFASALIARLKPGGTLVLSGLIERDVAEVSACYEALLGQPPEIRVLGEWRALVW